MHVRCLLPALPARAKKQTPANTVSSRNVFYVVMAKNSDHQCKAVRTVTAGVATANVRLRNSSVMSLNK